MSDRIEWVGPEAKIAGVWGKGTRVFDTTVTGEVAVAFSEEGGSSFVVFEGSHLQLMALFTGAAADVAEHLKDQRLKDQHQQ